MWQAMKRMCRIAWLPAAVAAAAAAQAAELDDAAAKRFFNDQGCNGCHGVDEVRIGPSYVLIAVRYADAPPEAVERLSRKILLGGAGAWGSVPMISHPGLSPQEARRVTRWILGLRPPGK